MRCAVMRILNRQTLVEKHGGIKEGLIGWPALSN